MSGLLNVRRRAGQRGAAVVLFLVLGACAPATIPGDPTTAGTQAASSDAASCRMAGGVMKPVGKRQTLQCVLTYSDAGRSCTSGSQCAGDCRAKPEIDVVPGAATAGICQATSDRFGCWARVENGRAEPAICID